MRIYEGSTEVILDSLAKQLVKRQVRQQADGRGADGRGAGS
jgi:hypothetical protein